MGINIHITFKISGMKDDFLLFWVGCYYTKRVSDLTSIFLSMSGLISSEIIKYVYNSKILNENLTTEEASLKDNSGIVVYVKNPLNLFLFKVSFN